MALDRIDREIELIGNVLIAHPFTDSSKHISFAQAEVVDLAAALAIAETTVT